jgi:hypothetical protein
MSDLVKRLRGHDERGGEGSSIFAEAAAEIEQLQALLKSALRHVEGESDDTLATIIKAALAGKEK